MNLAVAVTAQFTNWVQGTTTASFGAGVTINSLTITSPITATAIVSLSSSATTGPRDVTFTTGTEIETATGGFSVIAGVASLSRVTPSGGQEGQGSLAILLTAIFTHWQQGITQVFFGTNVAVTSVTVNSATNATAVINIDPNAALGPRQVSVQTGSEVVSLPNGFTITSPPASLVSVNPNTGQPGDQNLSVLLTGLNTHFNSNSVISFGTGVLVVGTTVTSPTSALALIDIDSSASIGPRTLTVVTNSEIASLANGFNIVAERIDLKLDHFVLTAGTSASFTDAAVGPSGPLAATPVCIIAPDSASASGLAPIISGETITTDQTTRGVYTLTCSLTADQLSASAAFTVLPPTVTTVTTTQQANFSGFSSATSAASSLLQQINSAMSSGRQADVNGALAQLVSVVNSIDFEALGRSVAFAPEGGFPADLNQLPTFGINPTPQDANVSSYLGNLISTLQSLTLFLQTNPLATLTTTQQTTYNRLQTALSMLVSQLPNLNPSTYAVVANADQEDFLFSNVFPEYFKALTAATTQYLIANGFSASLNNKGLREAMAQLEPVVSSQASWHSRETYFIRGSTHRFSSHRALGLAFQIGSLLEIELASQIQMNYVNQLYGGYFTILERAAATLSANGALQIWKGSRTLDGIISGASLSVFEFYSGDTVIEADNLNAISKNNTVFLIGPDQTAGVSGAIDYIRELHQPRDSDDAYDEIQGFKDLFATERSLYSEADQPPDDTSDFCLLGNSPPCIQLLYNAGFNSVYQRTRPVQLPAPVLIFVMNRPAGVWSSGVFNFEAAVTQ